VIRLVANMKPALRLATKVEPIKHINVYNVAIAINTVEKITFPLMKFIDVDQKSTLTTKILAITRLSRVARVKEELIS